MNTDCRLLLPVAAVLTAFTTPSAEAHDLNARAYVVGDRVVVEVYFYDGSPAHDAHVTVSGPDEEQLARGETDTEGRFTFTLARKPTEVHIDVDAHGHRASQTMTREDLAGLVTVDGGGLAATPARSHDDPAAPTSPEAAELRAAVVHVQATLEDMQRQLARLNRPRSVVTIESILTGIGFILGLTGVGAYCLARFPRAR